MLKIDAISGYCPMQAEGKFDEYPFYFRARHGEWELFVVRPGEDEDVFLEWKGIALSLFKAHGNDPWQGWMPGWKARRILENHYSDFMALLITEYSK